MYCIGLTGTIASGKSTVASFFYEHGVDIISADHIAKSLTAADEPALKEIAKHFGPDILTPAGELNRRKLRGLIFKNTHHRQWLEQLLHPLIRSKIEAEVRVSKANYCLIEIPLLTNRADYPYLNRILLILTNKHLQLGRLKFRDNLSLTEASAILDVQANEESYKALADDVLLNDGNLEDLREKVAELNLTYAKFALSYVSYVSP